MSESSRLFGHYLLVVGARLFAQFVTNDEISLEKEWDFWDFWGYSHNNRSSELDNVVVGRVETRKRCVDATQTIVFLEGAAVKLFIRYEHVDVKYCEDTVEISRKRLICRSTDPILGLVVSCFSAFAPVASAKNEGLARKLDKILT